MTPQQETLLPCPMCGAAVQLRSALWPSDGDTDSIIHAEPTECGLRDFSIDTSDGGIVPAWNRRAPAPTEPAVDRDAVRSVEGTLQRCAMMLDTIKMEWQATGSWSEYDQSVRDEISQWLSKSTSVSIFANPDRLKAGAPANPLATPASPAVPAESKLLPLVSTRQMDEAGCRVLPRGCDITDAERCYAAMLSVAPQVAQASQPASAGVFSGVNIDRVHHIMDGYTPKPPPPRPQRPPGPLWTDAERERFRENMKRGERCPICSVIEGGQHFPGCSRGVP